MRVPPPGDMRAAGGPAAGPHLASSRVPIHRSLGCTPHPQGGTLSRWKSCDATGRRRLEVGVSRKPRFLSLPGVQRELGLTRTQVMALIESGRLPAFQILGQWRVEQSMLDQMVDRLYDESAPPLEPTTKPTPSGWADPTSTKPSCAAPTTLTPQQERICRLVGEGMSNAEIADQLCLEISTVKSHLSRMLQRMDLRDRQQLVAHLWRSGFLSRD